MDRHDVALVRADNPSALTLTGTNTWVLGRDPAWVIDPGPLLDAHVEAVAAEVERRGGAGGIAITHDHVDHVEAVGALRDRLRGPPRAPPPPPPPTASGGPARCAIGPAARPSPPPAIPPTCGWATAASSGRSARSPSPATPTTTSCSSPGRSPSPATRSSATARCSSSRACAS